MKLPVDSAWGRVPALGDVDGDGDLDLVVANWGQDRLLRNDGRGKFTDVTTAQLPVDAGSTNEIALGDVDRDGDVDLVLARGQRQQRLYLNDGKGHFTDVTATRMPVDTFDATSLALVDVDRDGDLDVVFGCFMPPQNHLYLNDGKGKFTDVTASQLPVDSAWSHFVAVGDVDRDGDLDLAFANGANKQNALYLNDGKGRFTDVTATHLPVDHDANRGVVFGDLDGDSDLDLVFASGQPTRTICLYLNDGKGRFTDGTAGRLPTTPSASAVAVADLDEDGDLDIVFTSEMSASRRNGLLLNDGAGRFTDVTSTRMPLIADGTTGVVIGDVDGDRDGDLVFTNQGQNRLCLNLHRHAYAPAPARLGRPYGLYYFAEPGYAGRRQHMIPYVSVIPAAPPIPIPPFGSLGLHPIAMAPLPVSPIPAPLGMGSLLLTLPQAPELAGHAFYVQALAVHRLTPLEAHMTNVFADRFIR
jgi:hypothetical protein